MNWKYGIVYDEPADEFIVAEIYYRKDKPVSYREAELVSSRLIELEDILLTLIEQIIKQRYLVYNGKELK